MDIKTNFKKTFFSIFQYFADENRFLFRSKYDFMARLSNDPSCNTEFKNIETIYNTLYCLYMLSRHFGYCLYHMLSNVFTLWLLSESYICCLMSLHFMAVVCIICCLMSLHYGYCLYHILSVCIFTFSLSLGFCLKSKF